MASFFTNTKLNRRVRRVVDGKIVRIDEEVLCRVDLQVNTDAIMATLGSKALGNKSHAAHEIGGLVKVTVTPL